MYSSALSLTPPLDGVGWLTPIPDQFTPGDEPVHTIQEAEWALGPVWKTSLPSEFDPRTVPARSEWLYRICHPGHE